MIATAPIETWTIAAGAILGVLIRPWNLPEALWAVLGAAAMLACSLISTHEAIAAVGAGLDVYLFLTGMMLLAELARREGLFAFTAALATRAARGSAARLFTLIYAVGILVTVFLSNDATAVVLTPAVYAATRDAGAPPLPYLFVCAFIANAASFVLPISNPANLVVYGSTLPPLAVWLPRFALASAAAIAATWAALRLAQRRTLRAPLTNAPPLPRLGAGGRVAAAAIAATAVLLALCSALSRPLGLPTCAAGALAWIAILLVRRSPPWDALRSVSWSVLPLVGALFVLVRAIEASGALQPLAQWINRGARADSAGFASLCAVLTAYAANALNNLPLGLIVARLLHHAQASPRFEGALLIGVDLGPNLSVTGSLATLLWLLALRREGVQIGGWRFLRLGLWVMPLTLAAALGGYLLAN